MPRTEDTDGMMRLGKAYAAGFIVQKNLKKALEYLGKVAKLREPEGLFYLGRVYQKDGIHHAEKAFKCFSDAAAL